MLAYMCVCVAQARVLATIGITRGLGDHDLKVHDSDIAIKPFLLSSPEVCNSLYTHKHTPDDFIISLAGKYHGIIMFVNKLFGHGFAMQIVFWDMVPWYYYGVCGRVIIIN